MSALTELFQGAGPTGILLFGFLLTYFVWDVIKKINSVNDVANQLKSVSDQLISLTAKIDADQTSKAIIKSDIDEIKSFLRQLSHRVVAVETILQWKKIQEGESNESQI